MTNHALDVIEFERVLERVARRASSEAGRRRVLALRPMDDPEAVVRELERVGATMRFVEAGPGWGLGTIPEVGGDLSQLAVDGAVLDPGGLHRLGVLLLTARLLQVELQGREDRYPELATIADALVAERSVEKRIEQCVDAEGEVLSSASRDLKRLRDRMRGAHTKIVRKLEAYLRTISERFVVPDGSVTLREGRYVIPVRREGRGEVGGIVHDESQTGATLFIEPPVAIELMNELRDLEREEAREIRRVLGELTAQLAPLHIVLSGALHALADFDGLLARARAALAWRAHVPWVATDGSPEIRIREGRHPLLVEANDQDVVPFDLDLESDERCLVVSGPNTGGKSVFLKATGLVAALAQSGIVPPVGSGTRLPVFRSFFADIGDEQSIAQNLSTFSAHLANLSDLVSAADASSLVLIDEMGTGTDPAEGAALSRAVIEELVARGATTVVTSHLGDLKRLDTAGSGIVNASLQFDSERMEPTYRVVKGRPGRSYGLAIARRLGFPAGVLDRAERYRDDATVHMEDVLTRLESQERQAERLIHDLDMERARTERMRSDVESREQTLEVAERTASDRAREDARRLLLGAREEVEEAIRELREAVAKGEELDASVREARRRVEAAAERQQADRGSREGRGDAAGVAPGDRVRIHATGARGEVVELRSERVLVEVGAMRIEVPLADLDRVEAEPSGRTGTNRPAKKGGGWKGPPKGMARLEVDFRGMRADEIELALERALDEAILEELSQLRIIHGKGTGALRKRVGEILEADARVLEFRMGGPTEGGAGVTVATFGGRS